MTKIVLISVVVGGILGYLFMPDSWMGATEYVVIGGLSALLFFVGVDIGREGTAWQNLKKAGARILAFPLAMEVNSPEIPFLIADCDIAIEHADKTLRIIANTPAIIIANFVDNFIF